MNQGPNELQTETVARLRAARQQWLQVEQLRSQSRYEEALKIATALAMDHHPAVAAVQEHAAKVLGPLREACQAALQSQRNDRLMTAQVQFDIGDDPQVIKELEQIPESLRTPAVHELLAAARKRDAEVQKLLQEIRVGMMTHHYNGLLEKAARIRKMRPEDISIRRLYSELQDREAVSESVGDIRIQEVEEPAARDETGTDLWIRRLAEGRASAQPAAHWACRRCRRK